MAGEDEQEAHDDFWAVCPLLNMGQPQRASLDQSKHHEIYLLGTANFSGCIGATFISTNTKECGISKI